MRVPLTARRLNQSIPREISPDYSLEGLMLKLQYFGQARREWQDILKVRKENNLQSRLLYPFKYEGEIKSFTDKQKLREFCRTQQAGSK